MLPVNTMVLFNPVSGRGKAAKIARALEAPLRNAGHHPELVETQLDPQKSWLDPQLEEFDLAIVVGGDGAVRLASGAAGRTRTPIYHYPLGTENLFARGFRKKQNPRQLLAAIDRFDVVNLDVGIANGRKFLIMASLGFDAEVVHALAAKRTGSINHLSYTGPIIRTLFSATPPTLTVKVDDQPMVNQQPGWLVIANSRHYALGTDPLWDASMTDGLLDVAFHPASGMPATFCHMARARLRWRARSCILNQGKQIEIHAEPSRTYQLDGDPPETHAEDDPTGNGWSAQMLHIHLRPGFLPVLRP